MNFESDEDQKKKVLIHSNSARFSAQNEEEDLKKSLHSDLGEDYKKGLHPDQPVFLPNIQRGEGHDSILRTILRYLCITGTPN